MGQYIRFDKTSSHKPPSSNWMKETYQDDLSVNKEERLKKELQGVWDQLETKKQAGQLTKSQIADLELQRRIMGASGPENHENRYKRLHEEAIEAQKKIDRVYELVAKRANSNSQSVEQFDTELEGLKKDIAKLLK